MPKLIRAAQLPPALPTVSTFIENLHENYGEDEYRRLGTDSGLVVIFNYQSYQNDKSPFREGTNNDVNNLVLTFGRLGFNINKDYIFTDLSRGEMLKIITKLAEDDHTHRNCLIIIVLTHGNQHNCIDTYDAPVWAHEIWEPLGACPSLQDKPKFFIFQACKGGKVLKNDASIDAIAPECTFKKNLESDVLIAFSSVEGAKSWRHFTKGSWFIQELCRNFSAFGGSEDVVTLLFRVFKCVAYNYYLVEKDTATKETIIIKQMPLLISTLSKKFYLSQSKDRNALLLLRKQQEASLKTVEDICKTN